MIELFLNPDSLPFAVALGVMLLIALMEGVGLLFGIAFSGIVDALLPDFDVPDFDIPDVDIDLDMDADVELEMPSAGGAGLHGPDLDGTEIATPGPFTQFLGWLTFGRVPALVLLVAFLTGFGLSGLAVQSVAGGLAGFYLPAWLAVIPALLVAFPVTRWLGLGLAKIMPKEETEAVSRTSFIGKIATITLGEAKQGLPAEAKLKDHYGQAHYIRVEPDDPATTFPTGSEVLVVRQSGSIFRVIENTHAVLSKDPSGSVE
ncbi:MAG: YqiJ family protein [Pseudomonadota bacterium]